MKFSDSSGFVFNLLVNVINIMVNLISWRLSLIQIELLGCPRDIARYKVSVIMIGVEIKYTNCDMDFTIEFSRIDRNKTPLNGQINGQINDHISELVYGPS